MIKWLFPAALLTTAMGIVAVSNYMVTSIDGAQTVAVTDANSTMEVHWSLFLPKTQINIDHSVMPNFAEFVDVKAKKQSFFQYLTPFIEQQNQLISAQRRWVLGLEETLNQQPEFELGLTQRNTMAQLLKQYKIKDELLLDQINTLKERVNTIPLALALVQAANESAWGTSRFALEGNNFFGQWCFSKGCGIVPAGRPEGERYEVRKFDSVAHSVAAYFRNLNTHRSYSDFRTLRLSDSDHKLSSADYAQTLTSYSIRGQDYIDDLVSMIKVNKLEATKG